MIAESLHLSITQVKLIIEDALPNISYGHDVHLVIVRGVAYIDNLLKVLGLGQELEEGLVLAKLVKNLARVKGHVIVVAVLRRERVDKGVNNHNALFSEDFLHEPLVIGKLYLGLLRVDVKIVVV